MAVFKYLKSFQDFILHLQNACKTYKNRNIVNFQLWTIDHQLWT